MQLPRVLITIQPSTIGKPCAKEEVSNHCISLEEKHLVPEENIEVWY